MNIRNALLNAFLLPKPFEEVKRPKNFDVITPQAFGRNMYPDRDGRIRKWLRNITGSKKPVLVDMVAALRDSVGSDIEAFEKLDRLGFDPGRPNEILAETCVNLAKGNRIFVIGQWEAICAMRNLYPSWYCLNQDRLIAIWPPRTGYLATQGLLLEVKRIADLRGLATPCVVAHPEHMPRVYFLARKIFGKPVSTMTEVMSGEWFDPKSVQWWTRGRWRWLVYEMLARFHHRVHGWF